MTKRDYDIIRTVWEYRALTAPQLATLFFSSSNQNGQAQGALRAEVNSRLLHRLRMLYDYGYLFRDAQPSKISEGLKLVYFLDTQGAALLSERQGTPIEWDPQDQDVSYLFLAHLLATNALRLAMVLSAKQHGWEITQWVDEKTFKRPSHKEVVTVLGTRGGSEPVALVPDSYVVIEAGELVSRNFLEIDRGTETGEASEGRRDWARKIRAYLAYFQSGQYQERYHAKSLRILTVTTGERRLTHLKDITRKVGGTPNFFFTTLEQATTQDVLSDAIWQVTGRDGLYRLVW